MLYELNFPFPVHFIPLIPKMLMFTLAISYLTTSSLPWFMDLTFQVPMQYCFFCFFLQHWALLSAQGISATGCQYLFDSTFSFPLKLLFCSSPGTYWTPTNLEDSSFSVIYSCFFMLLMKFSRQELWNGLPFPSPVDHTLSELSPWPVHLGWPYTTWLIVSLSYTNLWSMWSFRFFCYCGFYSVCPLMDEDKRLVQASW